MGRNEVLSGEEEHGLLHQQAWERYRFWWRLELILFVSWIPFGIAADAMMTKLRGKEAETSWAVFIWAALMIVPSIRTYRMRCPACGQLFFHSARWYNAFARKCSHCGLPKWAGSSFVNPPADASKA